MGKPKQYSFLYNIIYMYESQIEWFCIPLVPRLDTSKFKMILNNVMNMYTTISLSAFIQKEI